MAANLPLKTGGPAWPPYPSDTTKYGLSLLDWFAGQALGGLCSNPDVVNAAFISVILAPQAVPHEEPPLVKTDTVVDQETLSQVAYVIAAEMIELRDLVPIDPPPVPSEETPTISRTVAPPLPVPANAHAAVTVSSDTPGVALEMPDHGRVAAP